MISLQTNAIYVAMFSRGDGTFHWALELPIDTTAGVKMHAQNLTGAWKYEQVHNSVTKEANLCVLVKIGQFSSPASANIERVHDLLHAIPMEVPEAFKDVEPLFRCRVWIKEALRVLAANEVTECSDISALEKELWKFGQEHDPLSITGAAPCKIYVATTSS